jgi:hypothetical protein
MELSVQDKLMGAAYPADIPNNFCQHGMDDLD